MSFKPPGYCPNCGDYVKAGAVACETCGSCHDTGWNDENLYDGLDLPEGYDAEEDTLGRNRSSAGSGWGRVALAVGLVAILLWVFVFR